MEKMSFSRPFRYWLRACGSFGTFISGNATCNHEDLLPDDAVIPHVITCQGRDHNCERTVRVPKPSGRQRPRQAGANPEKLARETMSHYSTLASIS